MGAWLGANRLLAEILAVCTLVFGLSVFWGLHDRKIETAATVKCENAVSQPQAVAELQAQLAAKALEVTRLNAEAQEHDALAEIARRPVTRAVWVCSAGGSVRPGNGAGSTIDPNPGPSAGNGSDERGTGADIRPRLEAFKLRYETVIEECRAALAECPTVAVSPLPPITYGNP